MKNMKSNPARTVLTIVVGFLIVYAVGHWGWALNVAIIVGLCGVLSTYLSKKIEYIWMKLTYVLSLIVPNILLSLVFFLILTPVAWLARLFSKGDQLMLKNEYTSIYKDYNKDFTKKSFEHPW